MAFAMFNEDPYEGAAANGDDVEKNYSDLLSGSDSKQICNGEASLLDLPVLDIKTIACRGPNCAQATFNFWSDLVLGQGATMIINLCYIIDDYSNDADCEEYWPTKVSQPFQFNDQTRSTVTIKLLSLSQLGGSLLKEYKLKVEDGTRSQKVTLLHFSGWSDLQVPNEEQELSAFSTMLERLA